MFRGEKCHHKLYYLGYDYEKDGEERVWNLPYVCHRDKKGRNSIVKYFNSKRIA